VLKRFCNLPFVAQLSLPRGVIRVDFRDLQALHRVRERLVVVAKAGLEYERIVAVPAGKRIIAGVDVSRATHA
jgi:hypothetical protein